MRANCKPTRKDERKAVEDISKLFGVPTPRRVLKHYGLDGRKDANKPKG